MTRRVPRSGMTLAARARRCLLWFALALLAFLLKGEA